MLDPDDALYNINQLLRCIATDETGSGRSGEWAECVANKIEELGTHISEGGDLPTDWQPSDPRAQ